MKETLKTVLPGAPGDRIDLVARVMDEAVTIPGIGYKVGLDPLIGLLPVAGEAITLVIHLYLVLEAWLADVPLYVLPVMLGLAALDTATSLVPIVGPLLDAVLKANKWNRWLIRRFGDLD